MQIGQPDAMHVRKTLTALAALAPALVFGP
jgi:hypothetical protein